MQPSRRAATIVAATAGALTLLANFHTTPGGTVSATTAAALPGPTSSRAGAANSGTGAPSTTASASGRTADGPVINTHYGPVQVRVTVQGGTLVDVQALELPNDRSRSLRISQQAG